MNFWRVQMLQQRGLLADPTRRLLGSNCGVSGQSISQLSKGANPEDFNRLRQCASLAKAEAATLGLTYGVVALKMLQGEYDYNIGPSAFNGPIFQGLTEQFYADFLNDVVSVIAGQTQPPAIFTYQTSGAWTRDPVISPATNANGVMGRPGAVEFCAYPP